MKNASKISIFVYIILAFTLIFTSCQQISTDKNDSQDGDNVTGEDLVLPSDNAIWQGGSQLGLVFGDGADTTIGVSSLFSSLISYTDVYVLTDKYEGFEHEIVIGKTTREISEEAYRLLEESELTPEQNEKRYNYAKYIIYSDGDSIAIAFEEQLDRAAERAAVEFFAENYLRERLVMGKGVVKRGIVYLPDFYANRDSESEKNAWETLERELGADNSEVAAALKELYSVYSDDLVIWFANLIDPAICICDGECRGTKNCGGAAFYYSNSARDTRGYRPDVESTNQALNFLEKSGILKDYTTDLPKWFTSRIVRFVKGLQDSDGYFYHPQWGKNIYISRRSRDMNWSVAILKKMRATPVYNTADGALKGNGVELTSPLAVSRADEVSAVISASAVTDPALQSKESFIAYLNALDVKNNSYSAGNTLASYASTIKARDRELKAEGADYQLMDIAIEHLNSLQNPETGTWYWKDKNDPTYSGYYAVNGLMKISCVYIDAWDVMPNIDKALQTAIDAIVSDEEVGAVVDIYNTWFAIYNMFDILKRIVGGEEGAAMIESTRAILLEGAPEAIRATADKITVFKKADGSFSYTPKASSATSQCAAAAVPNTNEGDVNATVICVTGTSSLIFECLGLDVVPIYAREQEHVFLTILEERRRAAEAD